VKKDEVIGTCLINSGFARNLEEAKLKVRRVFDDEFKGEDFAAWNTNIYDQTAKEIVEKIGRASHINVKSFIKDLWR
jgi:hypothetical protein